jgi:hypothetical protein
MLSVDEIDQIRQGLFDSGMYANIGLAQAVTIPWPQNYQLGWRQYPVLPPSRGYGSQNKRVFPTIK